MKPSRVTPPTRGASNVDAMTDAELDADSDAATATPDADLADPAPEAEVDAIDLDAMAADLDAVDAALVRLADGSYWTDEVTGEPLPSDLLESNPLARRA